MQIRLNLKLNYMKTTTGISMFPLIFVAFVLMLTTNCKKDKDTTPLKKTPVITWANPTDIFYGTLLSATQLNATADVAVTFVYTPAIGTKLNDGDSQVLKVTFSPTDVTNYDNVSKTVTINVIPTIVTDIDGNIYHTVSIGTQVWLVENLKTTKYNDNTAIPNVTVQADWGALTTPAYCWYGNNAASNKDTYGALYNWYVVNTGKLCPSGWHVPTDSVFTILLTYLGGKSIAGGKLKEPGTIYWTAPNTGADNSSGFTALPGGYRSEMAFQEKGTNGYCWTSTEFDATNVLSNGLTNDSKEAMKCFSSKACGASVRCIKD
jgi:uncharacterized protein (TIGR02145 family)